MPFERTPKTGASSSGGNHGESNVRVTPDMPVFMELVATLQRSNGLNPTGKLNSSILHDHIHNGIISTQLATFQLS